MFRVEQLDPIQLKGKSGAVPVADVRELSATERSSTVSAGNASRAMVDRRAEIRRIRRRLEGSARRTPGRVITITGEAGLGKSRLVLEVDRIARGMGYAVLAGSCQSHGRRTPYLPWNGLPRALFGLDPALPVAELPGRLSDRLEELDPSLVPRMPLLAPALNVPIPDTDLTAGLDAELRHELLGSLVTDVVRRRTAAGPILRAEGV